MKSRALFLALILCLPFASAGGITLIVNFEQQVIGSPDFNASGWLFKEHEDFAFEVDVPGLDRFYYLDFLENEVQEYKDFVPDGWTPVISTNENFTFKVNNLQGEANPSVFFLVDNDTGLTIEHLEAGEQITVIANKPTDYYLLIDADAFGVASFGLDIGEPEILVNVNFKQLPSVWEYVEKWGMGCPDDPSHACLIIDGKEFDFTACVDPASERNLIVGEGGPLEICVNGPGAYREWREDALERKVRFEEKKRAEAEGEANPVLAREVGQLQADVKAMNTGMSTISLGTNDTLDQVYLAIILVLVVIAGAIVVRSKSIPVQELSHLFKPKKEKEVEDNGVQEQEAGRIRAEERTVEQGSQHSDRKITRRKWKL